MLCCCAAFLFSLYNRDGFCYNIKDYDSDNIACTIKKYHSEKRATEEGWEHTSIELIPLNQDFEPFKLDPDDKSFKVLGILKKVIRE